MKTDDQLQRDVMAELKWEPAVNGAEIGVEVKNGIVTLAGHVGSYAEKWAAERATQNVTGVKALAVEMDVKLADANRRDDDDIAESVEAALEWMTYAPKKAVQVMVENGVVTLSGEVAWDYQRRDAASGIRHLLGVTGICNKISLKPQVSVSGVKTEIETALQRIAKEDASKIVVDIKGSQVTLTGNVQSWAERESVKHAVWGAPGVVNVVDKINVTY